MNLVSESGNKVSYRRAATQPGPCPMMTDANATNWQAWRDAADQPIVADQLRTIYDRLAKLIADKQPVCELSGRCCRFESYGHRLYVTGLEVAWLINQLDDSGRNRLDDADLPGLDGCPFQVDGLCSVHALRPLGCRIFFCDPSAQAWQNEAYEQLLADLRSLHDHHGLPYRYIEWRAALAEARACLLNRP